MRIGRTTTTTLVVTLLAMPSIADNQCNINCYNRETTVNMYGTLRIDGTYDTDNKYLKDSVLDLLNSRLESSNKNSYIQKDAFNINIAKTKIGANSITKDTQFGDIKTKIEFDLDGDDRERKLNVKLSKAFISFDDYLTIGRTSSTFIDPNACPDVFSPSNPIGQSNQDTSNINLIRYSIPNLLNKNMKIDFAIENSTFNNKKIGIINNSNNISDGRRYPTFVIAATNNNEWGHVSIRALQQHIGYQINDDGYHKTTHALQLSSAINIGQNKLMGTLYHGKGLGVYGTNLQGEVMLSANNKLSCAEHTGWQLGYGHNWSNYIRSNVAASGMNINKHKDNSVTNLNNIKSAQDYIINTIFSPSKNFEYGIEYVYEKAEVRHNTLGANITSANYRTNTDKLAFTMMMHF